MNERKEDSFRETEVAGKTKFVCLLCGRHFSSKQRIIQHLHSFHDLSPIKKVTKRYTDDPNIPVPKRTASRWKKLRLSDTSKQVSDEDGNCSTSISREEIQIEYLSDAQETILTDVAVTEHDETIDQHVEQLDSIPGDEPCDVLEYDDADIGDHISLTSGATSEISDFSHSSLEFDSDDDDTFSDSVSDADNENFNITTTGMTLADPEVQAVKLLSCFLRNNLSASTCKDILSTLRSMFPDSTAVQRLSYENIWKFVDDTNFRERHYCVDCDVVFPLDPDVFTCSTDSCGGLRYKGSEGVQMKKGRQARQSFVLADMAKQISSLLKSPGIWADILSNKETISENKTQSLKDITSGKAYKKLYDENGFLSQPFNITSVMNTDGVNLYSSSKIELWPVFLAVNELSPAVRFARNNMLLLGIWQGKGKPPFQQYMQLLSEELNSLYEEGIKLQTDGGRSINVKMAVVCTTLDLPAKASVLNMTYFNGSQPCITCEEPGEVVPQGKGHARCFPFRHERVTRRDHDSVRDAMRRATSHQRIKGFKGESGLAHLHSMNLVTGVVPDYMHCVLLGITKTLLHKWFSPTERAKPYFIGGSLKEISKRLQAIKPLECIERLPRDIEKHYTSFKATELQAWLLFYAIPCVLGILPDRYLFHFAALSEAIFILLGDDIEEAGINRARHLLEEFHRDFPELYSQGSCGLNIHNVGVHLVDFVQQWGPLWAWSCFPFEDANAMLLQSVHGTGNVTKQIMRVHYAKILLRTLGMSEGDCSKWKNLTSTCNCAIAGSLQPVQHDEFLPIILMRLQVISFSGLRKAVRVVKGQMRLYAEAYTRMQKRTCCMVQLESGQAALVKYFVLDVQLNKVFAVVCLYEDNHHGDYMDCPAGLHIRPISLTDEVNVVPVDDILQRLIFIETQAVTTQNSFVAKLPNSHGHAFFK